MGIPPKSLNKMLETMRSDSLFSQTTSDLSVTKSNRLSAMLTNKITTDEKLSKSAKKDFTKLEFVATTTDSDVSMVFLHPTNISVFPGYINKQY